MCGFVAPPDASGDDELAARLRKMPTNVFSGDDADEAREYLDRAQRKQIQEANDASSAAWKKITDRASWEAFAAERRAALRRGVRLPPHKAEAIVPHVTGKIDGDGYDIENIVYESRPGWFVTANLYRPAKPSDSMPGILLSHSHHSPKWQGELQDMGVTWARAGCVMLVPDHLGHGERAQHGLKKKEDYPREYAISRQDYYFRYDSSIQLYLAGETLMGWMAHDLMRGVDLLLAQKGVDKSKIILLGGVAGGGDPCGVTAALDERITCAVPFNFGGPQPETRYPLPDDAETWFNYAGGGGWESTRNLAYSAAPNSRFVHWEITSSIAPRRLIHGHEFSWDGERDPVWKRYQKVYSFFDQPENLAVAHGKGNLQGQEPASSHCGNIGEFHRQMIHPAFEKWFGIKASEARDRHDASDLTAMTPEAAAELHPQLLHQLLAKWAVAKPTTNGRTPIERRAAIKEHLAHAFTQGVEPRLVKDRVPDEIKPGHVLVTVDHEIPMLLLLPERPSDKPRAAVVAISRQGKSTFLRERAETIAKLLDAGIAVCLPDVRDTGELTGDDSHGQYSSSTDRAATALMLNDPLIAGQIRDVRAVLAALRRREEIDSKRIALWGDSFAPINSTDTNFRAPRRIEDRPHDVEPLGGMLALFTPLYEPEIKAVFIHRGLTSFASVQDSPFTYVTLDSVVPGILPACDLPLIADALKPLPMKQTGMVDGFNRAVDKDATNDDAAAWLIEQL